MFWRKKREETQEGGALSTEELQPLALNAVHTEFSRRKFLKFLGIGTAAAAIAANWPFRALAAEPDVIIVTVSQSDPHRSSLAAMVEHYCDLAAFVRYYGGNYERALQKFGKYNRLPSSLMVREGQEIRIPKVLLQRGIRKAAAPNSTPVQAGFQSPFGNRKKPAAHLCYQGTAQNPRNYRARVCPFDKFTARRGAGYRHSALDVHGVVGTTLYPLKPGRVVGAGHYYLDRQGRKRKFSFWRNNGKTVKIQAEDGFVFVYIHLRKVFVEIGQQVEYTTPVGQLGISGNASRENPHVHISMSRNGSLVDPLKYLGFLE